MKNEQYVEKFCKDGKTIIIDVTDMSIEDLWNIRHSLEKHRSLEIIIEKIIERLPKIQDNI